MKKLKTKFKLNLLILYIILNSWKENSWEIPSLFTPPCSLEVMSCNLHVLADNFNFQNWINHMPLELIMQFEDRKPVFWWGNLGNIWFSEPNFMKSENQFLIWKIIYFLCTLSQLYILCWDCFFFFSSPIPTIHLSLSPSLPNETDWHFAGVITGLPLSPFSFPLSLSFIPFRHHQERRRWQWWRTRAEGKKGQLVAIDSGNQQFSRSLTTMAMEAPT